MKLGSKNQIKGNFRQVKGKTKETAGKLIDDPELETDDEQT